MGELIAAANFSQELSINPLELHDNGFSNLKLDTGTLTWKDVESTSTEKGFNLSLSYTHKSDAVQAREAEAQAAREAKEAERRERYEERMSDNLADKLAELRAQGYTGEYPGDNLFTDINKVIGVASTKLSQVNKVVQNIPIMPDGLGVQFKEVEQVARATVGGGQITVRDNLALDLSGLNRDPARALSEETKYDFDYGLDTPFETLGQLTRYSKMVAKKSQDVEDYGFTTVVGERIDRGKSELKKGVDKLNKMIASFADQFKSN